MADDTSVPVITVELDWASDKDGLPPAVNGILVLQTGEANGWPTYRVSGPVHLLVEYLAMHYLGLEKTVAADLHDTFAYARFAKMADFRVTDRPSTSNPTRQASPSVGPR